MANKLLLQVVDHGRFTTVAETDDADSNGFLSLFLFELFGIFEQQSHELGRALILLILVDLLVGLECQAREPLTLVVVDPLLSIRCQVALIDQQYHFLPLLFDLLFDPHASAAIRIPGVKHLNDNI